MKRILVLVAMSIQLVRSAETPALIERPASGNSPTQVSVGIWIVDISKIDSAEQSFTAEVAVVLRWKDPRLAHTGNGVVRYPLEQIWHPRVGIVNETNSVSRKMPDSVEVDDCDRFPSTGRRFTSSSSLCDIAPTKSRLRRMRIGSETACNERAESRHRLHCQTGQLRNGRRSRSLMRCRPASSIPVIPLNSPPRVTCRITF